MAPWDSIRVWDFCDDLLAVFHLKAISLVVVAFADLLERYTLACTGGLASRLLKTGHIKASVPGFQLLALIL